MANLTASALARDVLEGVAWRQSQATGAEGRALGKPVMGRPQSRCPVVPGPGDARMEICGTTSMAALFCKIEYWGVICKCVSKGMDPRTVVESGGILEREGELHRSMWGSSPAQHWGKVTRQGSRCLGPFVE